MSYIWNVIISFINYMKQCMQYLYSHRDENVFDTTTLNRYGLQEYSVMVERELGLMNLKDRKQDKNNKEVDMLRECEMQRMDRAEKKDDSIAIVMEDTANKKESTSNHVVVNNVISSLISINCDFKQRETNDDSFVMTDEMVVLPCGDKDLILNPPELKQYNDALEKAIVINAERGNVMISRLQTSKLLDNKIMLGLCDMQKSIDAMEIIMSEQRKAMEARDEANRKAMEENRKAMEARDEENRKQTGRMEQMLAMLLQQQQSRTDGYERVEKNDNTWVGACKR